MRIYLDVSCLNRPFDDQTQERIRIEAEAVRLIIARIDRGDWTQLSSEMAEIEVAAIPDAELRREVTRLLPHEKASLKLDGGIFRRSSELQKSGLKLGDALHVAAAEAGQVDAFLTCDDRLLKWSKRNRTMLRTAILNPLDWITQHGNA
jgi:predicted nucleic acid-binding protein